MSTWKNNRKLLKDTIPICFISEEKLLIFKYDSIYILDIHSFDVTLVVKFKLSAFLNIISRISLFSRIFRYGIRASIQYDNLNITFLFQKKIHELNLKSGKLSKGFELPKYTRPLNFTLIKGIKGFDDALYFGEYKYNPDKESVSIYKRKSIDNWDIVYKFGKDEINHIHNLVPDPCRNIVYILTGDFDNGASIWIAEDGFKKVTPILRGSQDYRSCVAFPTSQGLVYATDSPFSKNSIRLLYTENGRWDTKELQKINGPCIYGCIWKDNFIFSTSVEGDGLKDNLFYNLFNRKKGKGIDFNSSFVYTGSLKLGFKELYQVEKDIYPFYYFQFGVLIFPSGLNNSEYLPIYHIATKKNSMSCLFLEYK